MLRRDEFEFRTRIINSHAAQKDPHENLQHIVAEFENDGWTVVVIRVHPKVGTVVLFKRSRV